MKFHGVKKPTHKPPCTHLYYISLDILPNMPQHAVSSRFQHYLIIGSAVDRRIREMVWTKRHIKCETTGQHQYFEKKTAKVLFRLHSKIFPNSEEPFLWLLYIQGHKETLWKGKITFITKTTIFSYNRSLRDLKSHVSPLIQTFSM